jgi:hypothetical protein
MGHRPCHAGRSVHPISEAKRLEAPKPQLRFVLMLDCSIEYVLRESEVRRVRSKWALWLFELMLFARMKIQDGFSAVLWSATKILNASSGQMRDQGNQEQYQEDDK